jgi:hypothetical protein
VEGGSERGPTGLLAGNAFRIEIPRNRGRDTTAIGQHARTSGPVLVASPYNQQGKTLLGCLFVRLTLHHFFVDFNSR